MENIKDLIAKHKNQFSESDKQIIQFVISNPELCSRLSLAKLAKKLYVSQSAIFRLCKKIGLSGYSELKFRLEPLIAIKEKSDNQSSKDFSVTLSQALQSVLKYFKGLNLDDLFEHLEKANHIYVYSTGWQQELIAQYLSHELFMIGKSRTVLPSAIDELRAANSFAKSGDILFIISYSGNNKTINEELSDLELYNDRFFYVSFTNMKQNTLASISNYNFYYPTITYTPDKDFIDGKVAFTPAYYLIDLLIGEYTAKFMNNK